MPLSLYSADTITDSGVWQPLANRGLVISQFEYCFQTRPPSELHKHAADTALAQGQSLNKLVTTAIENELSA